MRTTTMIRSLLPFAALLAGATGCGAGVPVQIRLDELTIPFNIDEELAGIAPTILPPGSTGLPERWPDELPDVCFDMFVSTDPDKGGRVDLTPDPVKDPENAQKFAAINDGLINRIELDDLVIRLDTNTLNVPLPVVEVQAADKLDADPTDRRAWRTVGWVGGTELPTPCGAPGSAASTTAGQAAAPGELKDIEFTFARGGESYLDAQLADDACANPTAGGPPVDLTKCKELSLRARTRFKLDTRTNRDRPRGAITMRLIVVATFYVMPL